MIEELSEEIIRNNSEIMKTIKAIEAATTANSQIMIEGFDILMLINSFMSFQKQTVKLLAIASGANNLEPKTEVST